MQPAQTKSGPSNSHSRLGKIPYRVDDLIRTGLDRLPRNLLFLRRFVLMVSDKCDLPVRHLSEYDVRMLAPEELGRYAGFHFSIDRAQQELWAGSACVLVHKGDQAVSWRWGGVGKLYVRYCNTVVDTGENGFFSYRLVTIESERYRGHVNTCMRTMYDYYKAMDRPLNYTLVSKRDTAIIRWHERCGFRTVGDILAVTVLGIRFCFYFKWPFHDRRLTVFLRVPPAGTREI